MDFICQFLSHLMFYLFYAAKIQSSLEQSNPFASKPAMLIHMEMGANFLRISFNQDSH